MVLLLSQKSKDGINQVTCFSFHPNCPPDNVFSYSDSYSFWYNNNKPDSWNCFYIDSNKIFLTSYLLRALNLDCHFSRSFKVEDSSNGTILKIISQKKSFYSSLEEVYFSCNSNEFFSFFDLHQHQATAKKVIAMFLVLVTLSFMNIC
jgi:hypothetical protein